MILPGTLVQYVRNHPRSALRANGIYTVLKSYQDEPGTCSSNTECLAPTLWLCEVDNSPSYGPVLVSGVQCINAKPGWCLCAFRILAPPITEADRLEMTAPGDGGAKQPSTRRPNVKVPGMNP